MILELGYPMKSRLSVTIRTEERLRKRCCNVDDVGKMGGALHSKKKYNNSISVWCSILRGGEYEGRSRGKLSDTLVMK